MSAPLLALALLARPAAACSCAGIGWPDEERCASSERVFAGVVEQTDWPLALDAPEQLLRPFWSDDVHVLLRVDRVWRGEVPRTLLIETGTGGGDCGMPTPPDTRFLVCDDGEGPVPWSFCSQPILSSGVTDVERSLGPWEDPLPGGDRMPRRWGRAVTVGAALMLATLGAGLGSGLRRLGLRLRLALVSPALGAMAVILSLVSLAFRRWDRPLELWPAGNTWPLLLGLGAALLAGVWGQLDRRGLRRAGLLAAMILGCVPLLVTRIGLHDPWPDEDEIACSVERAYQLLRREGVKAGDRVPACTDAGLAEIEILNLYGTGLLRATFPAGDEIFMVSGGPWGPEVERYPATYR